MPATILHSDFNDFLFVRYSGTADILYGMAYISIALRKAKKPKKLIAIDYGTKYVPDLAMVKKLMEFLDGEKRLEKPIYVVMRDSEHFVETIRHPGLSEIIGGRVVLSNSEVLALDISSEYPSKNAA